LVSLIALAGGGRGDDKQTRDNSKDTEATGDFKEVETSDIEGQRSHLEFSLDEEGEVCRWGEQEQKLRGDETGRVRRREDETTPRDEGLFSQGASLMPSGRVYTAHSDFTTDTYNMHIYDAKTDEGVAKEVPEEVPEPISPILRPLTPTIN